MLARTGPVNVETREEERFQKEVGIFLPGGGMLGPQGVTTLDDVPVEEVAEVSSGPKLDRMYERIS